MTKTIRPGQSEAANVLNEVVYQCEKSQDETVTFSNYPLHDQLIEVFENASLPNWDGKGSMPVDRKTLILAKELVESLPMAYRTPTICGEPDGHVELEWYVHPRQILTVSVNPDGRLHWAALIGEEDPRGSCRFYGETPNTLLYWIGRVCKK